MTSEAAQLEQEARQYLVQCQGLQSSLIEATEADFDELVFYWSK
jgi:hypothetical protein